LNGIIHYFLIFKKTIGKYPVKSVSEPQL